MSSRDGSRGRPDGDLELWGGIECTVARLDSCYRDQLQETGHTSRTGDIEAIAALGIKTLRYPVLWETVAPDAPGRCDWRWHDERLRALRERGLVPIAGLVHHGSGPRYTSLLDPGFPEGLADFARRVAERYPWVERFTPVNEPLTTARFSALYGHWYPHARDHRSFLRALVNQVRGVVAAMRAIRRITPGARLVQTDDLGKTFSSPALRDQAEYENHRRWLSFDLLCGRVDRHHPLYRDLVEGGIGEDELAALADDPCPPDIVGINHYLTSERYLDDQVERYPAALAGGNGRDRYADVEAVRMAAVPEDDLGPYARLKEAWERYRIPVAVTEAHHGCSRDEQIRWLMEVWSAAAELRNEGADIRAVTVWALFGATDWNSLLVERRGHYEPGAFDVRSTPPRPTALAATAAALARAGTFDHPVLDQAGWWRRPARLYHPHPGRQPTGKRGRARPLLITGARGTLGRAFSRLCEHRGLDHVLLSRAELDIADPDSVRAAFDRHRPWAVVNAAGYVRVQDAMREPDLCRRDNVTGAQVLARLCSQLGIPLVTFSSDLVFDGCLGRAYVEGDPVGPRCVYGASKVEAERLVSSVHPDALIVRTSAFFGPWDRSNFVIRTCADLQAGLAVEASETTFVSPTYVPDLVHATLDLLIDGASGVWHLANEGTVSWHGFALRAAEGAGLARARLKASRGERIETALSSARGLLLPSLDSAIERFFRDNEQDMRTMQPEAAE